jgi:hypothetical protein
MSASKQAARNQQQLDCAGAGGACPHGSDGVRGPGLDVEDLPLLSRRGFSHPLGKMDAELGKVRMHSETVLALQVKAAEHGMPLSEFVRIVLECVVYGAESTASVSADRIRRVGALVGGSAPHGSAR